MRRRDPRSICGCFRRSYLLTAALLKRSVILAKKSSWKVWLKRNLLTKDGENDFIAEVSTIGETLSNDDIATRIVAGTPGNEAHRGKELVKTMYKVYTIPMFYGNPKDRIRPPAPIHKTRFDPNNTNSNDAVA